MKTSQSKWIALLLVVAFAWTLGVTSLPLAAAANADRESGEELAPAFVEVSSQPAAAQKKKSILPYVLIGAGVVAAGVVALLVLKSSYDIVGTWAIEWRWDSGGGSTLHSATFSGSKKSGTISGFYGDTGTYQVDGKNVTWILTSESPDFKWTGRFDAKDKMSGTMEYPAYGQTGTWTATRGSSSTAQNGSPAESQVGKSWK